MFTWLGRLLTAAGVLALLTGGFFYLDSALFQRARSHELDRLLAAQNAQAASGAMLVREDHDRAADPAQTRVSDGAEVGRLRIPSLRLSAIILQGTGSGTLRRAVGHLPGSALPGQAGNVVLAGHRDTFFRPLCNIRPGDTITLQTPRASFNYRVASSAIVAPNDVGVLAPSAGDTLTLVTCYPFYFIGPAPRRFIVHAELSPAD